MLDNLSGQKGQRGFPYYSHYWFGKGSVIFKASELSLVLLSDVGVLVMAGLLYLGVKTLGWWTMLIFYGVPYLWLNHWIGMHYLLADSLLSRSKYLL
jgi:omega-6 fatty acid desaturase (delta-12 desaturase)